MFQCATLAHSNTTSRIGFLANRCPLARAIGRTCRVAGGLTRSHRLACGGECRRSDDGSCGARVPLG